MEELLHQRLTRRRFVATSAAGLAGIAAYGCAPAAPPRAPAAESAALSPALASSADATVVVGYPAPLLSGIPRVEGVRSGTAGASEITHSQLTVTDYDTRVRPMLAERVPSTDDGTWVVNPDGTMRMTWHLLRNATWHDGHPFTSKDVRFSWEFANDRSVGMESYPLHTNVTAIDTPDDNTVVMHWKILNAFADATAGSDLFILPQHIVQPIWQAGDVDRMLAEEFFHEGFVGLGPYRIDRWNPDGTIVFKPFQEFFLGPPKLGTVVVRGVGDTTVLLTQVLAGEVHVTGRNALSFDQGQIVEEQWKAQSAGTVYYTPAGFERVLVRESNPLFRDVRVRQALLLAIDRQQLIDVLFGGRVIMAHMLLHPTELGYQAADAAITKYPFDPRQALALMEQAGWRRGMDGVLANAAGEQFETTFRAALNEPEYLRLQEALMPFWRDIGVRVTPDNVAANIARDRTESNRYTGFQFTHPSTTLKGLFRRWHSSFIPTEQTQYVGDNNAHWRLPEADRLLEQVERTVNPQEMERQVVQLARLFSDEIPVLPLWYWPEVTTVHHSVKNARPRPNSGATTMTWAAYDWEWQD